MQTEWMKVTKHVCFQLEIESCSLNESMAKWNILTKPKPGEPVVIHIYFYILSFILSLSNVIRLCVFSAVLNPSQI
jgi:hypothetical protein